MCEFGLRLYKGLYKVEIVRHLGKKCAVKTLEETTVGNAKCGYETVPKGKKFVTVTRLLHRCG